MIKFFRKIRQKLLSENKFTKYLIYAIGEILLVVIGILLALQVNKWNELRKDAIFENKVISELYVDIGEDITEMNNALDSLAENQRSSVIIVQLLENKTEYHDSLQTHFANALKLWSLSPNATAFEMAKEEGMYLITNDSIRFYASKINGYVLDYIKVLENRFQDYKATIVLPHMQSLFESYNFTSMRPINFEALRQDQTYLSIIKSIISMRARYRRIIELRYEQITKLDRMIVNELEHAGK